MAHVDSDSVTDVLISNNGGLRTIFGDDSWRWMLVGPLESREAR